VSQLSLVVWLAILAAVVWKPLLPVALLVFGVAGVVWMITCKTVE
jgi:hypothetical protein